MWPHPHLYTNVQPEGGVVVLHVKECLQTCCFVVFIFILTYKVFITFPISYVHEYAPIIMYGLGLFIVTRFTTFRRCTPG